MKDSKKSILIVAFHQLPDRMMYPICKYLSADFKITIVSPFVGRKKNPADFMEVIYVNMGKRRSGNLVFKKFETFTRLFKMVFATKKQIRGRDFDLIYILDQTWAFLFKLVLGKKHKYVMQMYAPGVSANKLKNFIHDRKVEFNARFFDHLFAGSEKVLDFFKIPPKKVHTVGVGINGILYKDRSFERMDLVYLGALNNRHIHETVEGFADFFSKNKDKIGLSYTIIGNGHQEALAELKKSLEAVGPDVPVRYLGYLDSSKLPEIFSVATVGIVYHKVTPYFTHNISTKLYEYLFSGMPVIAVKNQSLLDTVNDVNGVLIDDNPEGFAKGLEIMMGKLKSYDSEKIAKSGSGYSVQTMVEERMTPTLKMILSEEK